MTQQQLEIFEEINKMDKIINYLMKQVEELTTEKNNKMEQLFNTIEPLKINKKVK